MLKEVYRMQKMFNNRVLGFDILRIEREEDRIKWLRNYLTAYDQELKELLESLDIRAVLVGAGKSAGHGRLAGFENAPAERVTDVQNIKIEIVDMLHFLISMFQVIGEKEVEDTGLQGGPASIEQYFSGLRRGFEERYGEPLAPPAAAGIDSRLVLIACMDLVSLGALLDCTAWKWWAKQRVRWDEARRLLYEEIFPHWCMMAMASGMDAAEAQELYFRKNRLNFERQEKGYKEGTYEKVDGEGVEDNKKLFRANAGRLSTGKVTPRTRGRYRRSSCSPSRRPT
jgi:dimeric dUTPase (all-alpha-NTP-PPase superfamily)